tara:strand:+ start:1551 stop:2057 length:507 start_codon:yes stop_codon:yes gene_type:complete
MGIAVTDVSTEQKLPLGFKYTEAASGDDMGERTWVYVFNDGGASLTAGCAAFRDPSAANASDPAGKMYGVFIAASGTVYPAVSVVGVAQHTIAAGSYGFIQCKGKGLVLNGTADITADTPITTGGDENGACIDYADGASTRHAVIAFSLEAEATNDVTFDAYINCLGA